MLRGRLGRALVVEARTLLITRQELGSLTPAPDSHPGWVRGSAPYLGHEHVKQRPSVVRAWGGLRVVLHGKDRQLPVP